VLRGELWAAALFVAVPVAAFLAGVLLAGVPFAGVPFAGVPFAGVLLGAVLFAALAVVAVFGAGSVVAVPAGTLGAAGLAAALSVCPGISGVIAFSRSSANLRWLASSCSASW